jgi:hypothetical protein
LLTPLKPPVTDELRWYLEMARTHPAPSRCDDPDQRFDKARDAFAAPRFKAMYKVWKHDGDAVLTAAGSHAISEAVEACAGRVETLELAIVMAASHPWLLSPTIQQLAE